MTGHRKGDRVRDFGWICEVRWATEKVVFLRAALSERRTAARAPEQLGAKPAAQGSGQLGNTGARAGRYSGCMLCARDGAIPELIGLWDTHSGPKATIAQQPGGGDVVASENAGRSDARLGVGPRTLVRCSSPRASRSRCWGECGSSLRVSGRSAKGGRRWKAP
jgi:hypothetical protein